MSDAEYLAPPLRPYARVRGFTLADGAAWPERATGELGGPVACQLGTYCRPGTNEVGIVLFGDLAELAGAAFTVMPEASTIGGIVGGDLAPRPPFRVDGDAATIAVWFDEAVSFALRAIAATPLPFQVRARSGRLTVESVVRENDVAGGGAAIAVFDAFADLPRRRGERWEATSVAAGGKLVGGTWPFARDASMRLVRPLGDVDVRLVPAGGQLRTELRARDRHHRQVLGRKARAAALRIGAVWAHLEGGELVIHLQDVVDDAKRLVGAADALLAMAAPSAPTPTGPYR